MCLSPPPRKKGVSKLVRIYAHIRLLCVDYETQVFLPEDRLCQQHGLLTEPKMVCVDMRAWFIDVGTSLKTSPNSSLTSSYSTA